MPTPILMPALSPTMEQGKLAKWLVKEGDMVSSGDAIAEIETDKATMEVEAVEDGKIGKIMVPAGTEGVAVNTPIAMLFEEGEDAASGKERPSPSPLPGGDGVEWPGPVSASGSRVESPLPGGERRSEAFKTGANRHGTRIFASPLARRLAAEAGLDLAAIKGTGPQGRIVKDDVEQAISTDTGAAMGARSAAAALAPNGGQGQSLVPARAFPAPMADEQILALYDQGTYEIQPHDNMRRTIAARLAQAKATIPHFYLSIDCELDALLAARQRLNERAPKDGPAAYKLSVNDFIIKALGLALQRAPRANATWTERGILLHKPSDVGVAVAVEGGLFTPVIRDVERKTLAEISNEMRSLAERARRRRLAPHDYQGATTSISNLGMYGIKSFDAVINPPHATILAVGQGEARAIVKAGQIAVATVMSCTLSCDHRVVDGALGAELLAAFKGFIEEPVTMLV